MACPFKNAVRLSICGLLVCMPWTSASEAQEPRRPFSALSDTVDEKAIQQYFNRVDTEIGQIANEYPQLADWRVPKGPGWQDSGKSITATSLNYAHARRGSARSSPIPLDRLGREGFELEVRIISERTMSMLSGASIGTFVFGKPLADGCVIALLRMADPKQPKNIELALRVREIVMRPWSAYSGESCLR